AGRCGGRGGSAGRRANHGHREGSDAPRAWLLAVLRSPEGLQQQAAPVPLRFAGKQGQRPVLCQGRGQGRGHPRGRGNVSSGTAGTRVLRGNVWAQFVSAAVGSSTAVGSPAAN